MSRIGKYPVVLKDGVSVSFNGDNINVKGKKGESSLKFSNHVSVKLEDNKIVVAPNDDTIEARKLWGTTKALINNMVIGVSDGFKVNLEIRGVGYRASVQGKNLVLQLGFSHDVIFPIPAGVNIICPDQTHITVEGTDKQVVGQVAAKIREFKKPEPYKGKGIRYENERVIEKSGKK
ncbi:MAG: 50S ribosomal protein L6 [Alphaproteobacteria bacterium]|jgi:large subunit ribosomal protein L6|nr:50S ribosomal protein L6 [Alphaproteobacteria bacterium]